MHNDTFSSTPVQPPARILVVEDTFNVRDLCARLLRYNGYNVSVAENGRIALDMLCQEDYDLVLTDLHMPEMNGIELLQSLYQHQIDVDKLVFTAFAEVETAKQALKLGAFDYLAKPVDANNLERTVRKCLEMRRIRQEKERLSELVAMYQFSQAIAHSLDIETQVARIVEFLWQRFAPESLSLSLFYPEDEQVRLLSYKTHQNVPPRRHTLALNLKGNLHALAQAHMQLIGREIETNQQLPTISTVLHSQDRPVGYLHLMRAAHQPAFDADEQKLLGVFASQIAASLDNARLYQQLRLQNLETVAALAAAIDARDPYTHGHSEQVTQYAVRLAERLGLSAAQIELIRYAGLLHDIGKIGIRDHILLKSTHLSDEEFEIMQQHPLIGAHIIRNIRALRPALPIIEGHHEQVNGQGYPYGLTGTQISIETRILAIADAFDAMTSHRAYRAAMETEEALAILQRGKGQKWDGYLVDAFVAMIRAEGDHLRTKTGLCPVQEILVQPGERSVVG